MSEQPNYATPESIDWEATAELWKERARDSDARVAELEAVIQKVRRHAISGANIGQPEPHDGFEEGLDHGVAIEAEATLRILSAAPSVVLGEHDQEVRATELEAFATDQHEWYPEDVFPKPTPENYHDLNVALARTNITLDRFSADLMRRGANLARERAAAIRNGEHA